MGFGGIGWDFLLISECVDNKAFRVRIDANAFVLDVGLPVSVGKNDPWHSVEVRDPSSKPDPNMLAGDFWFGNAGASYSEYGSGVVIFGLGFGKGTYTEDTEMSFDLGIGGGFGKSVLDSVEQVDLSDSCDCDQWNKDHFSK